MHIDQGLRGPRDVELVARLRVDDPAAPDNIVVPVFSSTTKAVVNNRVKKYDISSPQEGKAPFRNSDIELTKDAFPS